MKRKFHGYCSNQGKMRKPITLDTHYLEFPRRVNKQLYRASKILSRGELWNIKAIFLH